MAKPGHGNGPHRSGEQNVTRKGIGPFAGGSQTYGEEGVPGSMYAGVLQERVNLSNSRNLGPDGMPSSVGSVGSVDNSSRKTGKL